MAILETLILACLTVNDTIIPQTQHIDEVVISSSRTAGKRSAKGQVATIDEHLQQLRQVNLIRRGSYAWEPVVNSMQSERVSTTIDGMKIFYACTDKMDPVTSYVESGNLQSISLNSGLDGNPQATGNIGGSLDLRLRKVGFDAAPVDLTASLGHELNGHLQVYGVDAAISTHSFYSNIGAFYRHADNYKVGGGDVLPFSQFKKVNAFANIGTRLTAHDILEATFIADRATDVGYTALNMDVGVAQGLIGSLALRHLFDHAVWNSWETKLYYNHITHEMDDTQRPDVEIHMDMPGRSQTAGLYSILDFQKNDFLIGDHSVALNYDLYYNRLFADMTMYPGGAAPMYMVTWPDVGTLNTGLALTDNVTLTARQALRLSAKIAWQQQRLHSDEGFKAQKVFFPAMTNAYQQTTARIAASYLLALDRWQLTLGAGWGSRAPTVTEAYGYYLNNTFDRYDYMGNPSLKNESALELNASLRLQYADLTVRAESNAFFFSNYIIGAVEQRLSPMTIGAAGVKVYRNMASARIVNVSLTADWQLARWLRWSGSLRYADGRDDDGNYLPLVSPLAYASSVVVDYRRCEAQIDVRGNTRHSHYGRLYGETATAAWTVVSLSARYALIDSEERGVKSAFLRLGVENLFDRHYATYADWNHIPQKGRNIYMNLTITL